MASSLYPNPDLRSEALNRQGSLEPADPSTGEVMDSVFFNIENNSFKLLHSNYKGRQYDEEAQGNLLDPSDVWDQYGVKVEQPISERNAERMRDNLDEVARRNYNVDTLEHTSLNQARLFINGVGGSIITDPVQWALGAVSGGILAVAGKSLSKVPAIANSVKATGAVGRVGIAAGVGASGGFMEGVMESEILQSQAPQAGFQFTDEDYWNNVRANAYFGAAIGAVARAGIETFKAPDIRDSINQHKVNQTYSESNANKRPPSIALPRDKYQGTSPQGEFYNTHFSPSKEYSFSTQNPVSDLDLGEGYSFTSSRDYAFSEKPYSRGSKEDVSQLNTSNAKISLLDADGILDPEDIATLVEGLKRETDMPKEVLDEISKGQVPVKVLADVLSSFDRVKSKESSKLLRDIVKKNGFDGYSFKEGRLLADGTEAVGMHLFEMPDGTSVNHLNPDTPPARNRDTTARDARRIEEQKKLDYFAEKESDMYYDVDIASEFEGIDADFPNTRDAEYSFDVSGIEEARNTIREDVDYIRNNLQEGESPPPVPEDALPPEKAREVAKASDFCVRN